MSTVASVRMTVVGAIASLAWAVSAQTVPPPQQTAPPANGLRGAGALA